MDTKLSEKRLHGLKFQKEKFLGSLEDVEQREERLINFSTEVAVQTFTFLENNDSQL